MNKLLAYLLRWQASTPILYLVIYFLDLPNLYEVFVANLVGGLIFYNVDKIIFK